MNVPSSRRAAPILAGLSGLLAIIVNVSGVSIGDDGVGYQAIADSLKKGHGLGYFLEPRLTTWPPGWPTLMAGVSKITRLSTTQAAGVLNAFAAVSVVLMSASLLRRIVSDDRIRLAALAAIAVGADTMLLSHLLMTDLAFIAAALLVFERLARIDDDQPYRWVIAAGIGVWVAFSFRYVGVVLIGTGGLWLLVSNRPARKRLELAALFGAVSVIFPAVWMVRNHSIDGTLLGVRFSSARGPVQNLADIISTLGNFALPGVLLGSKLWIAVGLVAGLVVVILAWRAFGRERRLRSISGLRDALGTASGLLLLHVGVYTAYIWYVRSTTALNKIDYRLLNPIYLPMVLLLAALVSRLVVLGRLADATDQDRVWANRARLAFTAWVVLSIFVGVAMVPYFASGPRLFDGNYASAEFASVRANVALKALPRDCYTYSNLPNALYPALGSHWSPARTGMESNETVDDVARLTKALHSSTDPKRCLVWIDLPPVYGNLLTLAQLRQRFDLDTVSRDGDVSVYEFSGSK